MANEEHLAILRQGVEVWNRWRDENPNIRPDLGGIDLRGIDLHGANLVGVNMVGSDLRGSNLRDANMLAAHLERSNLRGANLRASNLTGANLVGADLSEATLFEADMSWTNLSEANLTWADLRRTILVETKFPNATLSKCLVYGIAVWKVNVEGAKQSDLFISAYSDPVITVDNLEIAQFMYLLLHNTKIRDVIDTLTTKAVLILGRFTDERKTVLEAIKNELRQRNYVPILFDFEKPASRDLTETIVTLAHLSRFVIADITDAKSIPQELQAIVPNLLSVPIQPIILAAQREYAMFEHFRRYPSVLPLHEYDSQAQLIAELPEKVIEPAERKVIELRG